MTRNAIVSAGQVTPEWLTAALRAQGTLPEGRVNSVTAGQAQATFASSVWRLKVNYSAGAASNAPHGLFLKTSNPALAPGQFDHENLQQEAVFYSVIAPLMNAAFTIPCYDVAYEPETGASHILLRDVSETHTSGSAPSSPRQCELAIDCLTRLHAFWWDHPRLGKDIGRFPTQEERQQDWLATQQSTTAFMAALGDQLPRPWRAVYENVLPALPALFERHVTGRNLTLVHGDAHLGNFLFPKDAKAVNTYLVDWQFWHPTIGGTDLAFMMAAEWEPEARRRLEHGLLRHYYDGLLAHGVQGYPWKQCWDDYRLSVILMSIFIPVWRWAVFQWAPDLAAVARSMTAFDDLGCSELLTTSRS
ncbi:MAG TPA: phosphotransferase [Anaerolineae bacterium]|nr:phosphotransferase [Anaerolineae bacterium]